MSQLLAGVLFCAVLADHAQAKKCHADECFQDMFPCSSDLEADWTSAAAYCASRTVGGVTATDYPTHAVQACGFTPSKYFSACACGPTCTPEPPYCHDTPAPFDAIFFDGLDCVLPVVEDIDPPARYALTPDGPNGNKAFEAWLNGPQQYTDFTVSLQLHFNNIPIQKGKRTKLTFDAYFSGADAGALRIIVDGIFREVFSSPLDSPKWSTIEIDFKPRHDLVSFSFGVIFSAHNAHIKVDNVLLRYLDL